ncbi:MAG: hydroxymethylbilane synthase [bacterium]
MKRDRIILGSRGSDLALAQAEIVRNSLVDHLDVPVEIRPIRTTGDRVTDLPLQRLEGTGFFTKELEEALLAGQADLAVHSLKDLPTAIPVGLKLGAIAFSEDRRELLIIRPESQTGTGPLPIRPGGVVASGSPRRQCQIVHLNSTLKTTGLRGNIPTRIRKLRQGQYDAIVIAAAGVRRLKLDLSDLETICLDPETFLPAPGQGMLAIQVRCEDTALQAAVAELDSPLDRLTADLERGLLARFQSGCSLPLGVHSQVDNGVFHLKAVLGRKKDDGWGTLKCAEVTGTDVETVIDRVFKMLQQP